jgi:hypothetical protein
MGRSSRESLVVKPKDAKILLDIESLEQESKRVWKM